MNYPKLKPCPCGQTPQKIHLSRTETAKHAYASGNCCGLWEISFRTNYFDLDSSECMDLAISEWNSAPRLCSCQNPMPTYRKERRKRNRIFQNAKRKIQIEV